MIKGSSMAMLSRELTVGASQSANHVNGLGSRFSESVSRE